ncbi:restriction endonuclease [Streptomyces sp. NPDC053755]|uniref:restriction endonuclease n=1 Tax=Streptomyces sp. NPDC053755 TaxID=3155815 RepID=UPI0034129ECB
MSTPTKRVGRAPRRSAMNSRTMRVGRAPRRSAFSMRQLILFFGLLAIVLSATGLALRLIARAAQQHPATAVAAAAGLVLTVALLRRARRSRARRGQARGVPAPRGGIRPGPGRRVLRRPDPVPVAADPVLPADEAYTRELPLEEPYTEELPAAEPYISERPGGRPGTPEFPVEEPDAAGLPHADGEIPAAEETPPALAADDYAAMDPDTFEQAVAALCARDGCRDVEVVGGAGDLGADVIATAPDGRRVVIQCKRYGPINKVGSQDVQRFGGTCFAVHGAAVAAVVTTGGFTQPAAEYAEQCGILCFDHEDLAAWSEGSGPAPWETAVQPEAPC